MAECKHEKSLKETGFGFGQLDYYCVHCGVRIESVPLEKMSLEEQRHVGWLTMKVMMIEPDPLTRDEAEKIVGRLLVDYDRLAERYPNWPLALTGIPSGVNPTEAAQLAILARWALEHGYPGEEKVQ